MAIRELGMKELAVVTGGTDPLAVVTVTGVKQTVGLPRV
jgi:hypothetical protein